MSDSIDYAPRKFRPVPVPAPNHDDALEHAVARLAASAVPAPAEPAELTDLHYVANSLHALRYLDLKKVASEMLGTERREEMTPAALADLMAEWAKTFDAILKGAA